MKTNVQGRNYQVAEKTKAYIASRLEKFDKFFHFEQTAQVKLYEEKGEIIVEITIPLKGAILRSESRSHHIDGSIDEAIDKMERQIRKHKTALRNRYMAQESIRDHELLDDSVEEDTVHSIVKTKTFPVKPMDAEEAVLQMKLLGHNFYVFINSESDEINVVYARKNGGFGLIVPQH
ncbi:ribosome hibernation-promoting factor, HPF/YfiA family [Guggenheimella bovis]